MRLEAVPEVAIVRKVHFLTDHDALGQIRDIYFRRAVPWGESVTRLQSKDTPAQTMALYFCCFPLCSHPPNLFGSIPRHCILHIAFVR